MKSCPDKRRVRDVVKVPREASQPEIKSVVQETESLQKYLEGKTILKEIFVPGKIYNIVVK